MATDVSCLCEEVNTPSHNDANFFFIFPVSSIYQTLVLPLLGACLDNGGWFQLEL